MDFATAGNLAVHLKVPDSTEPTTSIILQNLWLDKKGKMPNWIAMPVDIQHQRFHGFMRIMNFYIQEVFKGTAKVL
uniref:Uncharacterized protein n=1 Tax=Daphnia galeata TaxID=27404 RepID=A0A8J2WPT2_9CRUS|nr:unnamed protein product [Daphnia galeata]